MKYSALFALLVFLLTACNSVATTTPMATAAGAVVLPSESVTKTPTEGETNIEPPKSTSTPTLAPADWKTLPVVPTLSPEMMVVYQRGLARGRDPSRFSKIGDCQNITTYFLAAFDNPKDYSLGPDFAYLQPTIDHFTGSWSRESIAVHGGMNVAAVQSPFWDIKPKPSDCLSGESPLACEIRVYNPSIAIISMEESWSGDITKYDRYMRMIVEYVLSQDVVPILATRAEVPDPEISINATVARIAYDYQVPLWNFWAAANPLPSHGLQADGFHLTWAEPFFTDPQRMRMAWPWRNLTALQAIDAVWNGLHEGR
jgi:hypothetical protein